VARVGAWAAVSRAVARAEVGSARAAEGWARVVVERARVAAGWAAVATAAVARAKVVKMGASREMVAT
jgi:hypothetical protein